MNQPLEPIHVIACSALLLSALLARADLDLGIELGDPVPTPTIHYSFNGNHMTLTWDNVPRFYLQQADAVEGPWQFVAGADSPCVIPLDQAHEFYRLVGNGVLSPQKQNFSARAESEMGRWYFQDTGKDSEDWMYTRGDQWTAIRSGVHDQAPLSRNMAGNFLTLNNNTPIAVFFSAETYVTPEKRRLFVRALIDGKPMAPDDVVLASGVSPENPETHGFIFTGTVDRGLHTLEMEWLVDRGATAWMRDAAFVIRQGDIHGPLGSLKVYTPPSGPSVSTREAVWQDVPGLHGIIQTEEGETLGISVGIEGHVAGGGRMFMRAVVDGVPAAPSDVLFATGGDPQCRMMTFGMAEPPPGIHDVRIQWLVDLGLGEAFVGDRSLVLAAAPFNNPQLAQVYVSPPSGAAIALKSPSFKPVPGLAATGPLAPNSELAVWFSLVAQAAPMSALEARLTVDGQPVAHSTVQLVESDTHLGVHSYLFSAKHLYPNGAPETSTIRVEMRTTDGQASSLDDRSMLVMVKRPDGPDFTAAPPMGDTLDLGGGDLVSMPLEPAVGTVPVLVILFNMNRPNIPAPSAASAAQAVFGAQNSAKDYYDKVSGGKFQLVNALGGDQVLGWYDALLPDGMYHTEDGISAPGCFGPADPELRRREALKQAEKDIDFAQFDKNGDGVLSPQTELAVLLILPDDGDQGHAALVFEDNCEELVVDGVVVPRIAEWLTDDPAAHFNTGIHELGHLLFFISDLYSSKFNTEPGNTDIMGRYADSTSHFSAFFKLALGWATPTVITSGGFQLLEDVKTSHTVMVLPRLPGGAGDEYFVLENRQRTTNHPFYDRMIPDSGVAVWHIVQHPDQYKIPPVCEDPEEWNEPGYLGAGRRGVRLLRPTIVKGGANRTFWSAGEYDLLDTGLICNDEAGGDLDLVRNVLVWADGTASGYHILNWSAPDDVMTFDVVAP